MICKFKTIHCCQLMYLRTLEMYILKYMNLIPQNFFSAPGLAWKVALKKAKVKLDLLIDLDMQKKLQEEVCITLFINMQKLITNNMKDYVKNKESPQFNIGM